MTNNPARVEASQREGIPAYDEARAYLAIKRAQRRERVRDPGG